MISNTPVRIGTISTVTDGGLTSFFDGAIDEFAFYDRALTAGEIAGLYAAAGAAKGGSVIQGNIIGLDSMGTAALGNSGNGVQIVDSPLNVIGGNTAGARNAISANACAGININGDHSVGNVVSGNYLGIDITGTLAVGNASDGIILDGGAGNNTIGGSMGGARNVISGNLGNGLSITATAATGNVVVGNNIGTDSTGTQLLGNGGDGVLANAAAIVGTNGDGIHDAAEGNLIAFNVLAGVATYAAGVTVRGNSIHSNVGLGIDYHGDGVTLNGAGLQNFPDLTSVQGGASTMVAGTINGVANAAITLDFYANTSADPTEGKRYLGSTVVTTNGAGHSSFSATLSALTVAGELVTATATAADGSTSEFSLALTTNFNQPPTISSDSLIVTVLNPGSDPGGSPEASFGLVTYEVPENRAFRLDGEFESPNPADSNTVLVDWGDGTTSTLVADPGDLGFSFQHAYPDNVPTGHGSSDFAVTVFVTDATDNASGSAGIVLTVDNVPAMFDGPLALLAGGLPVTTVAEGDSVNLTGTISDPGLLDTHTLTINWGDGSATQTDLQTVFLAAGVTDFNVAHAFLDNNDTDTVTVTLQDDDSGSVMAQTSIQVTNVAPTVVVQGPTHTPEGSSVTLTAGVTDPGASDTFSYGWIVTNEAHQTVAIGHKSNLTFTPKNSGSYNVQLTVTDDDGGQGVAPPFVLDVQNVAPTIAASDLVLTDAAGNTVNGGVEGERLTLAGAFTDPGFESHDVSVDWGDGGPASTFSLHAGISTFSLKHVYADDNLADNYQISVTVTDAEGASGSQTKMATIANIPPHVSIRDDGSDGATIHLSSVVSDPGTLDTFAYSWNVTVDGTVVATGTDPSLSFARPTSGTTIVGLTVTDDDGGQGTATVLFIGGTSNADTIDLTPTTVTTNGEQQAINLTTVTAVLISSGDGDDVVTVSDTVTVSVDVFAGAGDDTVTGGSGDDYLDGGVGNDTVTGGSGNDYLEGGLGDDSLLGGEGNDTVTSMGNDTLTGGNGDDDYVILGFSDKVLNESGTDGVDTINFIAVDEGITLDLSTTGTAQTATDTGHQVTLNGTFEDVLGSNQADKLTGNAEQNLLFGGGGNDSLDGGTGNDTLDGGDGNDTLYGGEGNDTLTSGMGNDTLDGGTGNDTLYGGDGNDEGTERLRHAEYGDDTLFGGEGNDLIFGGGGNDSLDGGTGDDSLSSGMGNDTLSGGSGNDTIESGDGNESINAGYGNDSIDGGYGNDTLMSAMGTIRLAKTTMTHSSAATATI